MSQYEDALDESDDEMRKLCHDAARHLNRAELRRQKNGQSTAMIATSSFIQHGTHCNNNNNNNNNTNNNTRNKRGNAPPQTSSSENSSVERIVNNVSFKGRSPHKRVGRKVGSANGAGSTDSNENCDDWRHINYAFQEATCYPILYQLNQQLQILSSQLYEMEATNVLQLKLIYRVMKIAIKARRTSWIASSTGITFMGWIFLFSWPVILQILYNFYKRYYWL